MAKEWYEEDDNESVWWKATKKNARKICPDTLWDATIGGLFITGYSNYMQLEKTVGIQTKLDYLIKAGTKYEKSLYLTTVGGTFCLGSYAGGMLDAWYQTKHDGYHLGNAMADQVGEWWEDTIGWYEHQEQGVNNFLINLQEWWRA